MVVLKKARRVDGKVVRTDVVDAKKWRSSNIERCRWVYRLGILG